MTTKESDCKVPEENTLKEHWNTAYTKNTTQKLGWYEESSKETIDLIKLSKAPKDAKILNVGVGSSMLIDELLADGYTNLIANDLSEKAIEDVKNRLGDKSSDINFIVDDLIKPSKLNQLSDIDIWNDRAVLHFFLKEEEKEVYFKLLKQLVKNNGFVIIAVFALDGAEKCCGLELQKYNAEMLQERLGEDFELIKKFNYTFTNPYGGERPYIYTLFQRKNK
ncbi:MULTISPECIES: class I SAM-dependent methyltransferase [unclassified Tenacibaculum]|uniref:class I SAM-dependent methyltransferase n=1 Tax=unclassified Tenacibaculum TaxID=2635139 RepID=UPI001F1D4E16|nr:MULTISPECIES: class I SAM-dependent methyltransferase [unclassified Tenacibaculum]MCF2873085.1 class I SAM-dependent methyltransferase [Tenacibaculum sp. Cn5-1]MCF2933241.1 class I SAM-dependent methyltransferase [Tenacibaculum sp. Cn5-34]MCG7510178.1 class I SAM-dependent methyltransferase [Tenacibaculum sp. Cn5-46]